jgi:hypothetical protein
MERIEDTGSSSMKLEIKLDPRDIEEIAQRVGDIILRSLTEVESRYRATESPPEDPSSEKAWGMPYGEWWNDKDISKFTGISIHTVRQWRYCRRGPTYQKIGRKVLYQKADVLEFMNSFPKIKRRD